MSSEDVRKVSREDIQLVRILIGHCLELYMNQKEVIDALSLQAKIDPHFTELVWTHDSALKLLRHTPCWPRPPVRNNESTLEIIINSLEVSLSYLLVVRWSEPPREVWQQLEEQNREFFKAYYLRLRLKYQITAFNKLLEDQLQIINKEFSSGIPSMSPPDPLNGSSSNPLKQNICFLPETAPGSAMSHGVMRNGSASGIMNNIPSGDQLIYSSKDMHGLHIGIDSSSNLQSTQNSAAVLFGVDNGTAVKTESGYSTNADFAFGNSFLESCQSIGDASGGSFSSSELNAQPLNDSLLDNESSSFAFLSQIPQNFIFPDLAEDFSQSAEILENYNKSPFLASGNNFSDSAGGNHTG